MAGSSKPGPLGCEPEVQNLNDGTLVRALSPRPGPIGAKTSSIAGFKGKSSFVSSNIPATGKKAVQLDLQILRQGSRGTEVQKLQQQLNVRLIASPNLVLDGIFGPLTHQAVLQYQKGIPITADGIVGKQTWYHLLKGDKVTVSQAIVPKAAPAISKPGAAPKISAAVQPPKIASQFVTAPGIWEWPLEDKFADVLRRTAPKLPGSMRYEFEVLLTPTSLGIMAGTLVVWAGSHAFGVGVWVDAILLVGGAFFLGMAVFDVAEELGDFLVVTSFASDEKDLDEAASHLASVIAIIGVVAFIALLAKVAKGRGGKGVAGESPPKLTTNKPQLMPKAGTAKPSQSQTPPIPKAKLPQKSIGHRREHILNRHKYGANKPNKTEFPKKWSDNDIMRNVESVANDPNAIPIRNKYGSSVRGTRDGVEIQVDFYQDKYQQHIQLTFPLIHLR